MIARGLAAAVLAVALLGANRHLVSPFAGAYIGTRAGADATQRLTLLLAVDGTASLTTETPGYDRTAAGTPVYPLREIGTWRSAPPAAQPAEGDGGRVDVTVRLTKVGVMRGGAMTDIQREEVAVGFTVSGCMLRSVTPKDHPDERALELRKSTCANP